MSERKQRPPRLGRGLASLLGDVERDATPIKAQRSLRITDLTPGPFQPRRNISEEALEQLAASIRVHGILQPILVRPAPDEGGTFEIVAGERRWRAAQRAGLHEVPVHVRELDDATALAAALIENLQRQDLNAIEEAEGLQRLVSEFGLTQETVAHSVGRSRSHVTNMMRLLTLPVAVQDDVRRGMLSAGHARALLSHPDPAKAADAVRARGLNVRQTEALAKPRDKHPAHLPRSEAALDTAHLERDLTARLGLTVRITSHGDHGQVSLTYKTLDQLDGLVRLLIGNETA